MQPNNAAIKIEENILEKAKQNDRPSLEAIFQQFIGVNEKIHFAEYMGQNGIILLVEHNFACITEKRVISLRVGTFGEVFYQDAFLEDLNSSAIYQPSIFGLYVMAILFIIFTYGIGLLFLPLIVKWYYKVNKCGVVFVIKQGLSVYVFVNRNKLTRANVLWRVCAHARESRAGMAPVKTS
jgi:hypothetical protein